MRKSLPAVLIAQDSKNQSPKQHSKVGDRVDHPGLSRRNSQTGNYGSQSEDMKLKSCFQKKNQSQ